MKYVQLFLSTSKAEGGAKGTQPSIGGSNAGLEDGDVDDEDEDTMDDYSDDDTENNHCNG